MKKAFVLILLFFCLSEISAQKGFSLEFNYGMSESFSSNLTIQQKGQPDIFFFADYASHSLALPPYWLWRVGYWYGDRAWEFETIHHKLYVSNVPEEVGYFSISHGYNFLFITHAMKRQNGFIWRVGAGGALAHPENEVRGKELSFSRGILNIGYYLTGPCVHTSYGKRFKFAKYLFVNTEVKITYGYAEVPVVDGFARLHNVALHLALGLGAKYDVVK